MILHQEQRAPEPWPIYASHSKSRWLKPFYFLNWLSTWTAHLLSRWALLEVLEYLGTFSILIGVVFYFAESGDRVKQKHYQAWQVINTAQGRGGSGGRIEALQELNADGVALVGIDLSDAFLQGIRLNHADLARSDFGSADLRESSLISAKLPYASFRTANLRGSRLHRAKLHDTNFTDADLSGADLSGADLIGSHLDRADLRGAILADINWKAIASIKLANIFGAKAMPAGFTQWAIDHGAVLIDSDEEWNSMQSRSGESAKPSGAGQ